MEKVNGQLKADNEALTAECQALKAELDQAKLDILAGQGKQIIDG